MLAMLFYGISKYKVFCGFFVFYFGLAKSLQCTAEIAALRH